MNAGPRDAVAFVVLWGLGVLHLGCVRTNVVRDGWADWAADTAARGGQVTLGQDAGEVSSSSGRNAASAAPRLHRLRLAEFEGPQRLADGHEATVLARQQGQLQEVMLVDADGVAVLYGGRYAEEDDPAASQARKRLRALRSPAGGRFAGERPFREATVVLLDPSGAGQTVAGPVDPLDLLGHPGMYTLQVGFFDDAAKPDRHTAAERWAHQLRRDQGVDAYYHHGPNRSLVTVGLFARAQFTQEVGRNGELIDRYPEAARELQKRFPHNLGNGNTILERNPRSQEAVEQSSRLVQTPGQAPHQRA